MLIRVDDQKSMEGFGRRSPLPQEELMELRLIGMQAIRLEFVVQLLHHNIEIYTQSIYWEDGRNFMRHPALQKGTCKLLYTDAVRVSGEFKDISLLRYTHDCGIKSEVDAELDRMVTEIRNLLAAQL